MVAILAIYLILVVLVNDAGDVLAIYTWSPLLTDFSIFASLALFGADDGGGDPLLTICSRYTVLAVDADGAGLAHFSIFTFYAICASLTHGDAISRDIAVHEYMDGGRAICSLLYRSQQVLAGIVLQILRTGTGDVDGTTQLVGHRVATTVFCHLVGTELESFPQSFKAADGDVAVTRSIGTVRILDFQGHSASGGIHCVLAIGASYRIGHQMLIIAQHIAQVGSNLLGPSGIIHIVTGQFQCLSVIGDGAAGDVIVVKAVNGNICAFLAGQFDAALAILCLGILALSMVGNGTSGDIDIAGHRALLDLGGNIKELVFRSGPAMLDFRAVPVGVLQTGDIVIVIGVGAFRAISVFAALGTNQDTAAVGVTGLGAAYPHGVEPHIVSGGNGHVIRVVFTTGNCDILALDEVDLRAVRCHGFLFLAVHIQLPALVHGVDHRLDGAAGDILHIADIGAIVEGIIFVSLISLVIFRDGRGTAAHIVDLVISKGYLVAQDNHIFAAVIVGFPDGQALVIHDSLAGSDGIQILQVFGQFHRQGVGAVGDHADVVISEVVFIGYAAVDGGLFIHLAAKASGIQRTIFLDIPGIDLAVVHGGQVVDGTFAVMVVEADHARAAVSHFHILVRIQAGIPIMGVQLGRCGISFFIFCCIILRAQVETGGRYFRKGRAFIHLDSDIPVIGNFCGQVRSGIMTRSIRITGLDGNGVAQLAVHYFIARVIGFYNKCWGLVDTPVHKTPCLTIK